MPGRFQRPGAPVAPQGFAPQAASAPQGYVPAPFPQQPAPAYPPQPAPPAYAPQAAPAYAPPPAGNRWAGVQMNNGRDGMPNVGDYILRLLSSLEVPSPKERGVSGAKVTVEVIAAQGEGATPVSSHSFLYFRTAGEGATQGMNRYKAMIAALCGFASDAEYDAFDPHGQFLDATLGHQNARTEEARTLIGAACYCRITLGNPIIDKKTQQPTGGHYNEMSWTPADDTCNAIVAQYDAARG